MKILSIDLGATYGWCFKDELGEQSGHAKVVDLIDWGKQFSDLLDLWRPEQVVLSQTNNFGFWNASRAMLMKAGVAFYICGKKGISGVEFSDSEARKIALGKGFQKKELVQKLFPGIQADELDAIILARGWALLQKPKYTIESIGE